MSISYEAPLAQATYISYGAQANNYSSNDYMRAGVQTSTSTQYQTLIQFNVAAIKKGSVIHSATMRLYSYSDECFRYETTLLAKRNTSAFTASTVTFATRPSVTEVNQGSCTASGYDVWYEWDIKDIVQAWVTGTANYGLTVVQDGTTTQRGKCFKKSGTYAPQLVIEYEEPTSPGPPTGLYISPDPFLKNATFHWTSGTYSANNPITGYRVYYRLNNGNEQSTDNTAATSLTIDTSAMAPGTKMDFVVEVYSTYSDPVRSVGFSAMVAKNSMPLIPTNVSMSKPVYVPGDFARVKFTNNGDPDNNLVGFQVDINASETIAGSNVSSGATYVDVPTAGLTPGVSYSFRVRAYDALGACSAWSPPASALVGLPMKVVVTQGEDPKQVAQMKVVVTEGDEAKTVKSMKIAVTEGGVFKNVF